MKPRNAIYIANEEIFEFYEPVILGIIKIGIDVSDHSGIDRLEFYVNDQYVGNATTMPYSWIWLDRVFF